MGALFFKPEEVEKCIQKLVEAGKIIPFTSNGQTYHWLKNFLKYQKLTNPSLPKFPLPGWISDETKRFPSGKCYATYKLLPEKIPEITGSLPVVYREERKETNHKETKQYPQGADESFQKFWASFPKRRARAAAEKAWVKINPSPELFETIMTSLEEQKQSGDWLKNDGQFIPFGSTWLNGRRWEDDVANPNLESPSGPMEHSLLKILKEEEEKNDLREMPERDRL
jgi:hypothetical protein